MKLGIIGYGKMGRIIDKIATDRGHEVTLKVSKNNAKQFLDNDIENVDVAIEFTQPIAAFDNILHCIKNQIPVVSGTTGWLDQMETIVEKNRIYNGAFLYASNFSLGMNIFFKLNSYLAKLMNTQVDYSISMEEIHHTEKKDEPSGTAITLANQIIQNNNRLKDWSLGNSGEELIPIDSIRSGKVPGTHKIKYDSVFDEIEISHAAKNRNGFAFGAVYAAEWIKGKTGNFTMDDVLNLDF